MSQIKKVQKNEQKKSNNLVIISLVVSFVIVLAVSIVVTNKISSGSNGQNKNKIVKDSDLTIQISDITDKAEFYPVEIDGTKLEVLAIRATDGSVRTAFNTCQVCYNSGRGYYVQEGDALVCQNCGNRFGTDDVEVTKGGCNPVPITEDDKTVTDTSITVKKDYLTLAKSIFANWKS